MAKLICIVGVYMLHRLKIKDPRWNMRLALFIYISYVEQNYYFCIYPTSYNGAVDIGISFTLLEIVRLTTFKTLNRAKVYKILHSPIETRQVYTARVLAKV